MIAANATGNNASAVYFSLANGLVGERTPSMNLSVA
jgi:hypothetical protein